MKSQPCLSIFSTETKELYAPHSDFIPFFRDVDDAVKSVISQNGLEEHGDEIVKVS